MVNTYADFQITLKNTKEFNPPICLSSAINKDPIAITV